MGLWSGFVYTVAHLNWIPSPWCKRKRDSSAKAIFFHCSLVQFWYSRAHNTLGALGGRHGSHGHMDWSAATQPHTQQAALLCVLRPVFTGKGGLPAFTLVPGGKSNAWSWLRVEGNCLERAVGGTWLPSEKGHVHLLDLKALGVALSKKHLARCMVAC